MMKYRYRNDDEMKDSGVEWLGKIPKGWKVNKIKHYFNDVVEKNYSDDVELLSLYTHIGVKPQKDLEARGNKAQTVIEYKKVKQGDIVVNKMLAWMGAMALSEYEGVISPAYNIYRKIKQETNTKYYHYLFRTKRFANECYKKGWGIMLMRWTTTPERFKNIFIPFSDQEQQKIASFLDKKTAEFDTIIEKKQSLITKLTEAKKSLISEVVTGKKQVIPPPFDKGEWKLRDRSDDEMKDSGVEWLGKIPVEWAVSKLRYLGFTKNGISAGSDYFGSGYPFVSYGDVYKDIELPTEVKGLAKSTIEDQKNYSIEDGDVLFTRTSETIEEVGFSSTCMKTIEKSTFAGFLIRFRPIKNKLLKGFSKYYFSSSIHRSYFVKNMNLVTRASLSQELLKGLYVILPNLQEQQLIVNFLDEKTVKIDSTIAKVKLQIEKLKEAKQSLISEVVTGKIEVL